jgi:transposase
MVTDTQVRLLRKKRMERKTLEAAAAAAGMSEVSARKWLGGPLPSASKKPRIWRTRPDPFNEIWTADIEPLLKADQDGGLEAKTVFAELCRRYPERFEFGQLRTLQRRFREWRAVQGPEREVFFPQEHRAGQMAAIDFTHATELGVTIAGVLFVHLFFHFVLAYSGRHFVQLAYGETFEALLSGLQNALWSVGGVPEVLRMDNLSAATHELRLTGGRDLTKRFRAVLDHYGLKSSRIQVGKAHENGVVEKGHDLLKSALEQALRLRGSREFATIEAYLSFVQNVVTRDLHASRETKFAEERSCLRALPASRLPEYTRIEVEVRLSLATQSDALRSISDHESRWAQTKPPQKACTMQP